MQREITLETMPERVVNREEAIASDQSRCEGLLHPVFRQAVGDLNSDDRLLITMLVLDDVPQKDLARAQGINTGNVTRWRQRIFETIWSSVNELAVERHAERSLAECLELILAGESHELCERLAELVAAVFREGVTVDDKKAGR